MLIEILLWLKSHTYAYIIQVVPIRSSTHTVSFGVNQMQAWTVLVHHTRKVVRSSLENSKENELHVAGGTSPQVELESNSRRTKQGTFRYWVELNSVIWKTTVGQPSRSSWVPVNLHHPWASSSASCLAWEGKAACTVVHWSGSWKLRKLQRSEVYGGGWVCAIMQ